MQYYIERGNNIETPDQMYDAMCKATALSGFTANVLDIRERKSYATKKKIKNILKIHHVKYDYRDKSQTKFHVWQYSNIGPGKKFDIPSQPKAPKYEKKKRNFMMVEKNLASYLTKKSIQPHPHMNSHVPTNHAF